MKRVGTVEFLVQRIYPIDAENHNLARTEVIVPPGHYDLYQDAGVYYWMMTGVINLRGVTRLGDGMFSMGGADEASDVEVRFPSRRFGSDEFASLRTDPVCAEGDPAQRIRITLDDESHEITLQRRPLREALRKALELPDDADDTQIITAAAAAQQAAKLAEQRATKGGPDHD